MNSKDLKKYCKDVLEASMVGVASSDRFENAPVGHKPDDLLPGAKSVIVVGLRVLPHLFNWEEMAQKSEMLPESVCIHKPYEYMDIRSYPKKLIYAPIYRECGNEFLNQELKRIALRLALRLDDRGHDTIYLSTTENIANVLIERGIRVPLYAPFSHRHAAVLAGLGELGLNNLFLSPKYGCGIRLNSVITTAQIEPDPIYSEKLCLGEECGLCLKACPTKSFGKIYEFEMAGKKMKLATFDKQKCLDRENTWLSCGQCMRYCPVGK